MRYTSVRVSVVGQGTHSHDAYLAYDVPGFLVRWARCPAAREGTRGPRWLRSRLAVANEALRWVMYDQDGDRYLAKSFSVSIHYQVLA